MAYLVNPVQIQGLPEAMGYIDTWKTTGYPANLVNTSINIKDQEGNDTTDTYTADALLLDLKQTLDNMTGGTGEISLATLSNRIAQINAELNGGTYINNDSTVTIAQADSVKGKEINDVVRVIFNVASAGSGAVTITADTANTAKLNAHLRSSQLLDAYTIDGTPLVSSTGTALKFDLDNRIFAGNAAPYILDIAKTLVQDSDTNPDNFENLESDGSISSAAAVYSPYIGDFKVFPVGTWKFSELPSDAFLDNNELQMVAYDQALQQIILKLASDNDFIRRLNDAVGEEAIQAAVNSAAARFDVRIKRLEGATGYDDDPSKIAVKRDRITTATGSTVDSDTNIAAVDYVDAAITGIRTDLGYFSDTAATWSGTMTSGTKIYSAVKALWNNAFDKENILTTQDYPSTGVPLTTTNDDTESPDYGQFITSNEKVMSERAVVSGFEKLNSSFSGLETRFNNYTDINGTADQKYVQIDNVKAFVQVVPIQTEDPQTHNTVLTYSDTNTGKVASYSSFANELSKVIDQVDAIGNAAHLYSAIKTINTGGADNVYSLYTQISEYTSDTVITESGLATANTNVLSEAATKRHIGKAVELLNDKIDQVARDEYNWNNITGQTANSIELPYEYTNYNYQTGFTTTASDTATVTISEHETVTSDTHVYSTTVVDDKIRAVQKLIEDTRTKDSLEVTDRISYATTQAHSELDQAIQGLTASSTAVVNGITVDNSVYKLQQSTAKIAKITGAETATAIAPVVVTAGETTVNYNTDIQYAGRNTAETVDSDTNIASVDYVNQKIGQAVGNLGTVIYTTDKAITTELNKITNIKHVREYLNYTTETVNEVVNEIITVGHEIYQKVGSDYEYPLVIMINGIDYDFNTSNVFSYDTSSTKKKITWNNVSAGFRLRDVLGTNDKLVVDYYYQVNPALTERA